MSVIGTIAINTVMRAGGVITGARKASKSLDSMNKKARMLRRTMLGLGAAIGAAKLVSAFRETADAIDQTVKASRKLGLTSEALVGLRHAADQTAGAGDKLDMSLQRMTRRVAEAANGTGEAVKALKELRLDAQALNKMSPDRMFFAVADAMQRVSDQGDRVRLSFKLFDSEGVDLVNTLKVGSKELQRYTREAKKLGLAFSDEDAARIEKMNDELDKLSKHFKGELTKIVIQLGPHVAETVEGLNLILDELRLRKPKTFAGKAAKFVADDLRKSHDRRFNATSKFLIDSGVAASRGAGGFTTADGFTPEQIARLNAARNPFSRHAGDLMTARDNKRHKEIENEAKRVANASVNALGKLGKRLILQEIKDRKQVFQEHAKTVRDFGEKVRRTVKGMQGFQRRKRDLEMKSEIGQFGPREVAFQGNPLMEATTAEGFRALRSARADMIPKQQLAEAKKQTAEMKKQTAAIQKIQVTEHGIA